MTVQTKLINGDCFEVLKDIPDESINLILADLPYNETGNNWDKDPFPLKALFKEYERIIKEDGAIALTASMKFGTRLIRTAPKLYKYEWVWEKDNGTNVPNIKHQPFRIHEYVLIFGKGRAAPGKRTPMKYHPQKTQGKPYKTRHGSSSPNWRSGLATITTDNKTGLRYPKTIIKFKRDFDKVHPTQKPVALLEYMIKTYTDGGDTVLDNTMGSGSTGVASVNTGRNFIGIELDKGYFEIAEKRIEDAKRENETTLF